MQSQIHVSVFKASTQTSPGPVGVIGFLMPRPHKKFGPCLWKGQELSGKRLRLSWSKWQNLSHKVHSWVWELFIKNPPWWIPNWLANGWYLPKIWYHNILPDIYIYTNILTSIALHYIILHYITLHYIPLHYITLHYITLQCSTSPLPSLPLPPPKNNFQKDFQGVDSVFGSYSMKPSWG